MTARVVRMFYTVNYPNEHNRVACGKVNERSGLLAVFCLQFPTRSSWPASTTALDHERLQAEVASDVGSAGLGLVSAAPG